MRILEFLYLHWFQNRRKKSKGKFSLFDKIQRSKGRSGEKLFIFQANPASEKSLLPFHNFWVHPGVPCRVINAINFRIWSQASCRTLFKRRKGKWNWLKTCFAFAKANRSFGERLFVFPRTVLPVLQLNQVIRRSLLWLQPDGSFICVWTPESCTNWWERFSI